jgi:hypothetical protein
MAGHKMGVENGGVDTTVVHGGPLHNEELVATFRCGIFANKCCLDGDSETLFIDGKPGFWAAKPERICNYGKEKNEARPPP